MKKMSALKNVAFLILLIVIGYACNDDDDPIIIPDPLTIVDTAIATPDLSNLVAALQAADGDLVSVLNGNGPFTVLAPTNSAFETFLSANGFASLNDVPTDVLSQILLNHVISGSVTSTDLTAAGSGYSKTNADGAAGQKIDIYFNTTNGVIFNGISTVTSADISASNGIVHIVDTVIGLPTIVTHAVANPNLSSLVGALTTGGNTTFTDLLSSDGPFTVFAPTNDAFTNFTNPRSNDLNAILSNHVVVGASALSTGLSNGYVKTAATFDNTDSNLSLYINTDNGVVLNGISTVAAADIIATNGVIHVVDKVIDLPNIVDFTLADPTFETLVAALTRDDLTFDYVTTLSTPLDTSPAPFTVFAPTNTAFGDLLTELGVGSLADIAEPTLKATLDHHAVAGANVLSTMLTDNMTVVTLGGDITANVTGGATLTDANGRISSITAIDIQAANGVIHEINKVILPPL
ncbi:fasciclin domain-containing protein [Urechidicola croceus]|uniref:Adhesin n=1 Tax=Urechidicola croceus TaxID=1850246 RepID=A0A1D8P5Z9_9FLAO|nr:fasciclin domain-containing protein [Urechidicola croceus]AOW19996.1 adhesin [Urechidicola croceus]